MDRSGKDRRRPMPSGARRTFGDLATLAIRKRVRESNAYTAHWVTAPNLAWVRWPREDGRHVYCAVRRRHDWLTGELGMAAEALDLDELPLIASPLEANGNGWRIQLGQLLEGHERWWSSGGSEPKLLERIDWIALQLQLRINPVVAAASKPTR